MAPSEPIRVEETADNMRASSGDRSWQTPRAGAALLTRASRGGRSDRRGRARRPCSECPSLAEGTKVARPTYASRIAQITIKQRGPVRAVIKIDGHHANAARAWLPISVRLYFTAGSDAARLVNSFIWDGDVQRESSPASVCRRGWRCRRAP
jgi:hypothetical protein